MKITTYNLIMKQDEDFHNVLVKEKSVNYDNITHIQNPENVYRIMTDVFHLDIMAEEYIYLIALNVKGKPTGFFEISHGSVSQAILNPREICIRCLLASAKSFILCHNHPSGESSPSQDDILATKKIREASQLVGLDFLDHIIVGQNNSYYSFNENHNTL